MPKKKRQGPEKHKNEQKETKQKQRIHFGPRVSGRILKLHKIIFSLNIEKLQVW